MNLSARFLSLAVLSAALVSPLAAAQAQSMPSGPRQQPDLHAALHIRPDQEQAYRAYQAAGPHPDEIARLRQSTQNLGAVTTPERLDRINTLLTTQIEVFHRKAAATRGLYMTLSPDQQHTFDEITAPPPGRGGPPRG